MRSGGSMCIYGQIMSNNGQMVDKWVWMEKLWIHVLIVDKEWIIECKISVGPDKSNNYADQ